MTTRFEAYLNGLQRFGIRPGLERIRALLEAAANPQLRYPVVLVGGTNGKGSTCEFLTRSLAADGYRTGLFTSPHLYRWNERIRVLGQDTLSQVAPFADAISDDEFDALLDDTFPLLRTIAQQHGRPTEFESLTFMGLWHFARTSVDFAVVEVGLGGRWDATNATEPIVSVITHVALDHCDRLGSTVEEIALDKVEIARPGRILITAETRESVLQIFRDHCEKIGARLWPLEAPQWATASETTVLAECLQTIEAQNIGGGNNTPAFQRINARTAAVARWALSLETSTRPTSLPAPAAVPGRAEKIRDNPIVILDGSNNPDGAAHLAGHLETAYPGQKFIFVAGISADKDWAAMIAAWTPLASRFIATQAGHPRAAAAETLAAHARLSCANVEAVPIVSEAVERALALAGPNDTICICGSFFVLAEADRERIRDF